MTMTEPAFIDYSDASYSANARIRIMQDAVRNLRMLTEAVDSGRISQFDFVNAASMNIVAYGEQLNRLPRIFWKKRGERFRVRADMLRLLRNNLAHSYLTEPPDYELIRNITAKDIPYCNNAVLEFYERENLAVKKKKYPTNRHTPRLTPILNDDVKEALGYPIKKKKIVSENKKHR